MELGVELALLRGAHVASLLSLVGALLFMMLLAPTDAAGLRSRLHLLAGACVVSGLVLGLIWFVAEAQEIAGAQDLAGGVAALPAVISSMRFGQLLLARLLLLGAALGLLVLWRAGTWAALALALVALFIQPWLGHPGATPGRTGDVLIGSELVHLIAASEWLGGLVPLLMCLELSEPAAAARVFRRFTWLALGAVLALAATAAVQGSLLAGGMAGLVGTPYGRVALFKAALFLAALVLAALNGLVLTGRLAGPAGQPTRRSLRWSLTLESLIGLAIVMAAGWLAGMAPGVEQVPALTSWRSLVADLTIPTLVAVAAAALLLSSSTMLYNLRNRS